MMLKLSIFNKSFLKIALGFYLLCVGGLQSSSACDPQWKELPQEIWKEFFEELNFKPKAVIVLPQINFKLKQSLAKFLYKKGYKQKWVKAAGNIADTRIFLKCLDQHLNSNLDTIKAHLSFARLAQAQFCWKSPYLVSRETYLKGNHLFIKHYAFAASKGSSEARFRLRQILNLKMNNPNSPFAWLFYLLIKKHQLKTIPLTPSATHALVRKEGNEIENEILQLLKKYAD